MSKAEHLLKQAARAERLARSVNDVLTIELLLAYAVDCRNKAAGEPNGAVA